MNRRPVSQRLLLFLTGLGLAMPIAVTMILGAAALVSAMDDTPGSTVLKWIGFGLAVIWAVDLVALVLAQAINALGDDDDQQGGS